MHASFDPSIPLSIYRYAQTVCAYTRLQRRQVRARALLFLRPPWVGPRVCVAMHKEMHELYEGEGHEGPRGATRMMWLLCDVTWEDGR
jgi:hypothetical protein